MSNRRKVGESLKIIFRNTRLSKLRLILTICFIIRQDHIYSPYKVEMKCNILYSGKNVRLIWSLYENECANATPKVLCGDIGSLCLSALFQTYCALPFTITNTYCETFRSCYVPTLSIYLYGKDKGIKEFKELQTISKRTK